MRKAATKAAGVRRGRPGWHIVTWLVVLAFTLQSFVTETHIHRAPQASAGFTNVKLESASRPDKSPIENIATCPFCQAIVHAGAFFASAAPLLDPPVIWADYAISRLIAAVLRSPTAHNWQSRAPPPH
jgi:hypothetical protein